MSKKSLAVLIAIILAAASFAGCAAAPSAGAAPSAAPAQSAAAATDSAATPAAADNPYAEHVSFTVFSLDDNENFMNWPLVKEAEEKFNFDFKVQQVAWDNWDETTRTLAATDSLPEVLAWYNLNYSEYKNWVAQGVFKALPDLTPYPNLKAIADKYEVFKHIAVDGKLYAFPKIINNNPYNTYSSDLFIFRKDWTTKMGKEFSPVQEMTWEDFVSFLGEFKTADPGKLGDKLVPLDLENGGLDWVTLIKHWNQNFGSYKKVDGKYVWGTDDPSTLVGINKIKELYDKGLLAKDSYADKMEMGHERFFAGRSAVLNGPYGPTLLQTGVLPRIQQNFPDFKETDLGLFALTVDGKYVVSQSSEWWAAFAFSGKCTDAQLNRFLAVGNWLLDTDQVEKYAYGVPNDDWTKDASGKVTLNYTADQTVPGKDKAYILDQRMYQKFYVLEGLETWLPGNPSVSSYLVSDLFKTYMQLQEKNPQYRPLDYDYDFFTGTNKDQYGCLPTETQTALIQAVVSDDPEKTWNEFVANNKSTIQLVLDELNASLGK